MEEPTAVNKPLPPPESMEPDQSDPTQRYGYLRLRLRPGQCVKIAQDVEVCIAKRDPAESVELAIRAPRHIPIRRMT